MRGPGRTEASDLSHFRLGPHARSARTFEVRPVVILRVGFGDPPCFLKKPASPDSAGACSVACRREATPTELWYWLPGGSAAGGDRIVDRRVVTQIVGEICSAARLVTDGESPVVIQIAIVDDIRAAGKGAEGWRARSWPLGGGRKRSEGDD